MLKGAFVLVFIYNKNMRFTIVVTVSFNQIVQQCNICKLQTINFTKCCTLMLALLPVLNSVYKRSYIAITVKFKKILNMHKYRVDGSKHEILLATNILEVENSL